MICLEFCYFNRKILVARCIIIENLNWFCWKECSHSLYFDVTILSLHLLQSRLSSKSASWCFFKHYWHLHVHDCTWKALMFNISKYLLYSQTLPIKIILMNWLFEVEPNSHFRMQSWIDYWKIEPTSRSKNTAYGFSVKKNQFNNDFWNDLWVQYSNNQLIIAFLKQLAVQYSNNQFMNVILNGTLHLVWL